MKFMPVRDPDIRLQHAGEVHRARATWTGGEHGPPGHADVMVRQRRPVGRWADQAERAGQSAEVSPGWAAVESGA